MECTDKEWQHCLVEKMGCEGCAYDKNNIEREAIEYFRKDIEKRKQGKNYFIDYQKVMLYEEIILNLIQNQQAELEKKDNIIDEMAEWILDKDYTENSLYIHRDDYYSNCIKQVKQYFENKVNSCEQ